MLKNLFLFATAAALLATLARRLFQPERFAVTDTPAQPKSEDVQRWEDEGGLVPIGGPLHQRTTR